MTFDAPTNSRFTRLNKKARLTWEIQYVSKLRFEEKLSLNLIAERMGKSVGWVRTRVLAATAGLDKVLIK